MTLPGTAALRQGLEIWPSATLDPRRVRAYDLDVIGGSGSESGPTLRFIEAKAGPSSFEPVRQLDLPDEFYMREIVDVDVSDERSLVAFAREWGPILIRRRRLARLQLVPGSPRSELFSEVFPELASLKGAPDVEPSGHGVHICEMSIAEYRAALLDLRTVCYCWLVLADAVAVDRIESLAFSRVLPSLPDQLGEEWATRWREMNEAPPTEDDMWFVIEATLDLLMSVYQPAIFRRAITVSLMGGRTARQVPRQLSPVALDEACALQLFNHIIEVPVYRHCTKQDCGRPFYRQRGRAKKGQNRTVGVEYCTKKHAEAEASRARREQIKEAARLAGLGLSNKMIANQMRKDPSTIQKWRQTGFKSSGTARSTRKET